MTTPLVVNFTAGSPATWTPTAAATGFFIQAWANGGGGGGSNSTGLLGGAGGNTGGSQVRVTEWGPPLGGAALSSFFGAGQ